MKLYLAFAPNIERTFGAVIVMCSLFAKIDNYENYGMQAYAMFGILKDEF